ncbi:MAG: leucine-rich repeat domain-containing protein [Treponema sp.]|nr:leucine-rich repeat domain-containing protein [Treponema sp.]
MKKLFLGIALVVFSALAQYHCPEAHFRVEPIDGGRSIQITGYVGNNRTVRIPPTIRGLPVSHIGDRAFQQKNLIYVTIPNSVIHIGNFAFEKNQLTSIVIPNGVTDINTRAFHDNQLTNVIIGNSVTIIRDGAFRNNQLTNITIPGNVSSIGFGVFRNNQLTRVTIPGHTRFQNPTGRKNDATSAFDAGVVIARN